MRNYVQGQEAIVLFFPLIQDNERIRERAEEAESSVFPPLTQRDKISESCQVLSG
jgi:hypothetical protein